MKKERRETGRGNEEDKMDKNKEKDEKGTRTVKVEEQYL
jgi:hypothetical protein